MFIYSKRKQYLKRNHYTGLLIELILFGMYFIVFGEKESSVVIYNKNKEYFADIDCIEIIKNYYL